MIARGSTARAWLELTRVSNLPTCISNVLVGLAIGGWESGWAPGPEPLLLTGAIALLYVSGMALNDVVDAPIDARERRERPIPSGRVSRRAALAFALITMLGGLVLLAPLGRQTLAWGGALAASIALYDVLHKKVAAAVLLMGACRGLVYVVAASAVAESLDWTRLGAIAGAMTAYVVALTLLARREHRDDAPPAWSIHFVLPLIALSPIVVVHPAVLLWTMMVGLLPIAWLVRSAAFVWRRPSRVKHAVMAWLAGICLVDAYSLTLLDSPGLAVVAIACFALTALAHRRIAGT